MDEVGTSSKGVSIGTDTLDDLLRWMWELFLEAYNEQRSEVDGRVVSTSEATKWF